MGCEDRLKKLRRRQLELVEENLEVLADASLRDEDEVSPFDVLNQLDEGDNDQGLCKLRSLDIFLSWYVMGGANRGISLTELSDMPEWLLTDFKYLLNKYHKIKSRKEKFKKTVKDAKTS